MVHADQQSAHGPVHNCLLQMLPFTPISEQLLTRDWVATEYPIVAKALLTAAQGWKVHEQLMHCGNLVLHVLFRAAAPTNIPLS